MKIMSTAHDIVFNEYHPNGICKNCGHFTFTFPCPFESAIITLEREKLAAEREIEGAKLAAERETSRDKLAAEREIEAAKLAAERETKRENSATERFIGFWNGSLCVFVLNL